MELVKKERKKTGGRISGILFLEKTTVSRKGEIGPFSGMHLLGKWEYLRKTKKSVIGTSKF